jgi:hypothetical protein
MSHDSYGKWTVLEEIDRGGNCIVYKCKSSDGEIGALKRLKGYHFDRTNDDAESERRARRVQRFLDEVTFLIHHNGRRGVVDLRDHYLPSAPSKSDEPWIVMPLGRSLSKVRYDTDLSLEDVVKIFCELAQSLAGLHRDGISHRDIKPDNILLINNEAHFGDFGLVDFAEKRAVTIETEILGPLFYVAPELMYPKTEADFSAADVYSFAKSLWVVATGQTYPPPGEQRIGVDGLRLSSYLNHRRAAHLDTLIDRCTRHSPVERMSSEKVASELEAWLTGTEIHVGPVREVADIMRTMAGSVAAARTSREEQTSRKALALAMLEEIADAIAPVARALNEAGFEDSSGKALPTTVVFGEGISLWESYLHPNLLLPERDGDEWYGGAGTLSQFINLKGTAILSTGVRIVVSSSGLMRAHGAIICVPAGNAAPDILWSRGGIPSETGSAIARKEVAQLVRLMIEALPSATLRFVEAVKALGS